MITQYQKEKKKGQGRIVEDLPFLPSECYQIVILKSESVTCYIFLIVDYNFYESTMKLQHMLLCFLSIFALT